MSTFSSRTDRLLNVHFYPFNCEQAIIFTSLCLQFGISAFIFGCLSSTPLLVQAVFVYVHFPCVCVCLHAYVEFFPLAVGSLSGLQVLKSMRFNTSSNLTLSDIALKPWKWDWKDTEALFFLQSCGFMSLRWGQLSFHWSVMAQREKTKLPLKAFHSYLFYDFEKARL